MSIGVKRFGRPGERGLRLLTGAPDAMRDITCHDATGYSICV
jgi:hypothetical protein